MQLKKFSREHKWWSPRLERLTLNRKLSHVEIKAMIREGNEKIKLEEGSGKWKISWKKLGLLALFCLGSDELLWWELRVVGEVLGS